MSEDKEELDRLQEEAVAYRDELSKRGVIYMSRVPPFMKPNKARNLLEPYGEITRLYLAEEDSQVRKKRKDNGGNGSKQFKEGWIEFSDKKVAKQVAESLNNTPMGGKKSDYYHDDIWNLKYLKGFKWEYLTEKLTFERRIRESKLRAALLQSRKSNQEMAELIEKTKVEEQVQERKKKKRSLDEGGDEQASSRQDREFHQFKKKFQQKRVIGQTYDDNNHQIDATTLKTMFSK